MGQGQAENEVTKGSQGPEMCSAVNRGRRPPHPLGDSHFTVCQCSLHSARHPGLHWPSPPHHTWANCFQKAFGAPA